MRVHTLSTEHISFINSGIRDPYTREPFKIGDRIVVCGGIGCGIAYFADHWQELGTCQDCSSNITLSQIPFRGISSTNKTSSENQTLPKNRNLILTLVSIIGCLIIFILIGAIKIFKNPSKSIAFTGANSKRVSVIEKRVNTGLTLPSKRLSQNQLSIRLMKIPIDQNLMKYFAGSGVIVDDIYGPEYTIVNYVDRLNLLGNKKIEVVKIHWNEENLIKKLEIKETNL